MSVPIENLSEAGNRIMSAVRASGFSEGTQGVSCQIGSKNPGVLQIRAFNIEVVDREEFEGIVRQAAGDSTPLKLDFVSGGKMKARPARPRH